TLQTLPHVPVLDDQLDYGSVLIFEAVERAAGIVFAHLNDAISAENPPANSLECGSQFRPLARLVPAGHKLAQHHFRVGHAVQLLGPHGDKAGGPQSRLKNLPKPCDTSSPSVVSRRDRSQTLAGVQQSLLPALVTLGVMRRRPSRPWMRKRGLRAF